MTDAAMLFDIRAIARALGGDVTGRDKVLAPGPGHSRKDRSLSILLDGNAPDGFVICSHAQDDWKTCRDYVRARLGLPDWRPGDEQRRTIPTSRIAQWDLAAFEAEAFEGPRSRSEDELMRIGQAQRIYSEAAHPRATLAETYLTHHRKLELTDQLAGAVLRFHPRCPWRNEDTGQTDLVPAMIAPFRSIDDNTITGIQRVRLNADGSKYGRRMIGIVQRAAIKLDPVGDELCIGEGVETCMAGRQLGFTPSWALGSAGAISFFPIIERVKRLVIFGEAGEASARAVKICTERWRKAHRKVRLVLPGDESGCSDLNDILLKRAAP